MDNYSQPASEENDLFSDVQSFVLASSGKRLANYLIDMVGYYAFVFLSFFLLSAFDEDLAARLASDDNNILIDRLFYLVLYGLYMGAWEALTKGRSLGKFITQTKVVNYDGSSISPAKAFTRGISRAVPFEVFSGLGGETPNPWHDRWTNTHVIEIDKSVNLPE